MTIHTDTFPLVCQQAANTPMLQVRVRKVDGLLRLYLENCKDDLSLEAIDISSLVPPSKILALAEMQQPVKIQLIDNNTFKHILERLTPTTRVLW